MKKWTRWQDWVALAAGLFAALSTLFMPQVGASMALMLIFGALLVITALVNLAMPGMPAMEWAQVVVAALLFLSPWFGAYVASTGAAWTSWIAGLIAAVVTATAIKPSTEERSHHRPAAQH
jgi:hypothetical protein